MDIGKKVKTFRIARSVTQEALAQELGVTAQAVSRWENGACFDWCSCNHRELIDYYYGFVEKNPAYRGGYMWLLDNLLAGLRLEEALDIIRRIDRVKHDYYPVMMEGYVRSLLGEREAAEALFARALEEEPENLYAWSLLGDIRVKQRCYDEAVACFEKSSALDPNPGFTDNYFSIAYIREMHGRWNEAAEAYEKALALYRENKKLEDGFGVEQFEQAILRCRAKA